MSDTKAPEFEPPQACVNRVIKSVLPDNVQVTKDARAAFTRAAGIFIFYLTHCANDFCKESRRQTIYTLDIQNAIKELDFEEFEGPLEEFLAEYRAEVDNKKKLKGGDDGGDDEGDGEEGGAGDNDVDMKVRMIDGTFGRSHRGSVGWWWWLGLWCVVVAG